jgi:uncharacterized membrane protein YciS (DUF1049 family)
MRFALVILLLLAVAAGMFALAARATDPVEIDALGRVALRMGGFRLTTALGVLLTGAAAIGLVIGMLVMAPSQFAAGRRAKHAQKRLTEVEASRSEAAAARAQASAELSGRPADETARLADEVSRRTEPGPPPPPRV